VSTLQFHSSSKSGFTLIELVIVIVLVGVLSAVLIPKFKDFSNQARIATLKGIAASMRSTIGIIRSEAYFQGLTISSGNPGGGQAAYIVTTEAGSFEIDWRNLCPESRAEMADTLTMADHISFSLSGGLSMSIDNRYTRVGYDIQGSGPVTASGCYVTYDSFGDPLCTVDIIINDC